MSFKNLCSTLKICLANFERPTCLPPNQCGGPCKTTSKGGQTKYFIFFDLSLTPSLAQCDRNRSSCRITIPHDIVVHPIIGKLQFVLDELTDTKICLVGYKQRDIFFAHFVRCQCLLDYFQETNNSMLKNQASILGRLLPGSLTYSSSAKLPSECK